jgi:CP family cyanate transporter-like MFS transporter
MREPAAATVVVLAGISAALHVGKLPPALPVLQAQLGVTLLEAGFLLSLVQLAGMTLGLVVGLAADGLGLRRTMVAGLLLLAAASLVGAWARTAEVLLALRACEGLGFLLASLPAPALIRRLVVGPRLSGMLGWWGAYMPVGTSAAMLLGPACMALAGWQGWWRILAGVSLAMGAWLWFALPASCDRPMGGGVTAPAGRSRVARTLGARGPWLASVGFAVYSAQWLAVIGFLPSIYAAAGLSVAHAAVATALAAGINAVGNIASGRLLQRGTPAPALLRAGYVAMAVGAFAAFAPWSASGEAGVLAARYGGILLFSCVGGLVPGTLFSLAVRLAPDEGTVSTTVGWMQQWSALGQFVGPPLVAWTAARSGHWDAAWWVTAAFAAGGLMVTHAVSRLLQAGDAPGRPAL